MELNPFPEEPFSLAFCFELEYTPENSKWQGSLSKRQGCFLKSSCLLRPLSGVFESLLLWRKRPFYPMKAILREVLRSNNLSPFGEDDYLRSLKGF